MSDDQEAIRRVLAGDLEAFRFLVQRHQGPLFGLIGNLIPDVHEREDVAQDAFLTAYTNLASYQAQQGAFSTWLLTIARNKCLNVLKRRRPVVLASLPDSADMRPPESDLSEQEWLRLLDEALAALPFEQRTVFVLAEMQGLSHVEIGRIEDVSVGTVKSRLSRAREKLRSLLRRTAETG
jgi:RNA polymerase sigma-70 factor (ECF subfamily)